jgi:hypothetical protein
LVYDGYKGIDVVIGTGNDFVLDRCCFKGIVNFYGQGFIYFTSWLGGPADYEAG